jgi:hypothetical protein
MVGVRPKLISPALVDRLVAQLELGMTLDQAARSVGVSPRSVLRWLHDGRGELDELSIEARLVLAVERVRRVDDWREAARQLETVSPERWALPDTLDERLR